MEFERHAGCAAILDEGGAGIHVHAFTETFSTLTGGRLGFRVSAEDAAGLLRDSILPFVEPVLLSASEIVTALEEAESRGVRGGAVHDYLHLVAARKSRAARIYTLNTRDFLAFHRPGDPEIAHP